MATSQREKQEAQVETERLRALAENTRIEQERVARQRDEAAASVRRAGVHKRDSTGHNVYWPKSWQKIRSVDMWPEQNLK